VRKHPFKDLFLVERTRHGMVIVDYGEAWTLVDELLSQLAEHDPNFQTRIATLIEREAGR